ncbi:MAG: hypothetical protein M3P01_09540 [Actinomycetota bacterium]|nr:hypothetical protein [Actinomycetota bacterium]
MVQWTAPLLIGIYLGILIDPWLRAWITQNDWARQARHLEDRKAKKKDSGESDRDRSTNKTGQLAPRMRPQDDPL